MNREEIRQKIEEFNLKTETVSIDEWNTEVVVKELKGKDYIEVSELSVTGTKVDKSRFIQEALLRSVYTTEGELLFTEKDRETVSNLPASIYLKLLNAVNKVNGIDNPKN